MNFETFYKTWYSRVRHFAYEYVLSEDDAENIAQDVFMELYKKDITNYSHSYSIAYLFTSVKNKCIDHLRHKIVEQAAVAEMQEEYNLTLRMKFDSLEAFEADCLSDCRIEEIIEKGLASLPERCRVIFIKNKIEGKKQKEIAEEMNISVKTVENQVAIGYKKLKEELKNYMLLLLFIL